MNTLKNLPYKQVSKSLLTTPIWSLIMATSAQAWELSWSAWIDSGYILGNGTELSQTIGMRGNVNYDFDNGFYIGAWWRKDTAKDGCDEVDILSWYKTKYNDLKIRVQGWVYFICNPKVKLTQADIITGQVHLNTWPFALSGFYGHPTAKGKQDGWGIQPKYNFNENFSAWFRYGEKEWTWNEYLVLQWSLWHDIWDKARIWVNAFYETLEEDENGKKKWEWIVASFTTNF